MTDYLYKDLNVPTCLKLQNIWHTQKSKVPKRKPMGKISDKNLELKQKLFKYIITKTTISLREVTGYKRRRKQCFRRTNAIKLVKQQSWEDFGHHQMEEQNEKTQNYYTKH